MDLNLTWYWLIGGATLMLLELLAPGVFLLWIGLGTLMVGVISLVLGGELSTALQLTLLSVCIFTSVGTAILLERRAIAKRSSTQGEHDDPNAGLASLIGCTAKVLEAVDANTARISLHDTRYTAVCTAPVKDGDSVQVVGVRRQQLIVTPADQDGIRSANDFPGNARYSDDSGASFG